MKPIMIFSLTLTIALTLISCSREEDLSGPDPYVQDQNQQDGQNQQDDNPDNYVTGLKGYPKSLKQYKKGVLEYEARFSYRSDGQISRINYGHPSSSSEILTDQFIYDDEGRLVKLLGWDIYDFYWTEGHISGATRYNGAWYGTIKIYYTYDNDGRVIERTENYIDAKFGDKKVYSYYEDGNLRSIESFFDENNSGDFTAYNLTSFGDYTMNSNFFPELEFIPGQVVQNHYPNFKEFKDYLNTGYDYRENFRYAYDSDGRVIAKESDSLKVVYEYY